MSREVVVHHAGPGMSVQDLGRPGNLTFGLSRGGAADPTAVAEGAALMGQRDDLAVIEMPGAGGTFEFTEDTRIALTGAPMRATLDGARLAWGASYLVPAGVALAIGPAEAGVYGYLSVGGGIATSKVLGSRATHFTAGLGAALEAGSRLPIGPDKGSDVNLTLPRDNRFDGGNVRILPGSQTSQFGAANIERFAQAVFTRDTRANRMGARLLPDGDGFAAASGLSIVSEVIVPGDIQITGDGTPFILLSECQTTGGYPRIGAVLPSDLPRIAQAAAGVKIRFQFVSLNEAVEIERRARHTLETRLSALTHLVRDPHRMRDLLSYNFISGVTDGETFSDAY